MKKLATLLFFFATQSFLIPAFAQKAKIDSLKTELKNATQDTARLRLYIELTNASDVSNNLLYAVPSEQLADKLLSQTTDDSARKKILMFKASAYGAMSFHYSQGNDADMNKVDEYGKKAIEILEQIKDTANLIGLYQWLSQWNLSQGNFPKALEYIQVALSKSQKLNYKTGTGLCYAVIADMYRDQGENDQALIDYENALAALNGTKDTDDLRNVLAAMGGFYYKIHNMDKSLEYYHKVISIYEEQKQNDKIGFVYQWIGDAYSFNGEYPNAIVNYKKSLTLLESTDRKDKIRQVNDAIGEVYFKQKDFNKAIEFHLKALKVGEEMKSESDIASSCLHLAHAYHEMGNDATSKKYNDRSLEILKKQFDITTVAEAELLAAQIDSANGNGMSAFAHYKQYSLLNEKLKADEIHSQAQKEKFRNDFDKQKAIDKAAQEKKDIQQRNIRNSIAAGLGGALIFLVVVYRQRNKISKARKRSDELLLNILPEETAEELKATGAAEAKSFDEVTVMFTDFKNFTQASEKMNAKELVSEINFLFSEFDKIISEHTIEKIKTIGDSYMCAGGLPVANKTNATDVVDAALEIQNFMNQLKEKREKENKHSFEIRIGIHTGPVIAGIVGIKKFAYDIWGDTVNIASRMESSGEAGKVNISGATYELVKNKFNCVFRGKIPAKNKGEVEMYFVEGMV